MITSHRARFNRGFDAAAVQRIRDQIATATGEEITFPLAASPVFVSRRLARWLAAAVSAFFARIRCDDYRKEAAKWVPEKYRGGGQRGDIPSLSQFDFALGLGGGGELIPRLLECQGLSSFMGVVPWFGHLLTEQVVEGCTPFLSYRSWREYCEHLISVVGDSVLVDIDASQQRSRTDFLVLQSIADVEIVDLTWDTLRRLDSSRRRIYSRVLPVETELTGHEEVFQAFCRQPRDWVLHPDWFFMLGKRSLPWLREVSDLVPETVDLTAETAWEWAERVDFVLKPANEVAGRGVVLHPTPADVEAALRSGTPHVLQERVQLAPWVQPPDGPRLFCELRMLCLEDRPVGFSCRLTRDPMCSVVNGKMPPWCGTTVGLVPKK